MHKKLKLPSLQSNETEHLACFHVRQRNRLLYPGACSLEYQSMVQIALECLFGWDVKTQKGRARILGILEAWCRADEEQGRGDVHGHWLIWISGINKLREMIRSQDTIVRQEAIHAFLNHVNKVMSAKYGDFDLVVAHECENNITVSSNVSDIYDNDQPQVLRDARQKKNAMISKAV